MRQLVHEHVVEHPGRHVAQPARHPDRADPTGVHDAHRVRIVSTQRTLTGVARPSRYCADRSRQRRASAASLRRGPRSRSRCSRAVTRWTISSTQRRSSSPAESRGDQHDDPVALAVGRHRPTAPRTSPNLDLIAQSLRINLGHVDTVAADATLEPLASRPVLRSSAQVPRRAVHRWTGSYPHVVHKVIHRCARQIGFTVCMIRLLSAVHSAP